ncbi:hypothetical protein LIPSTDRAFT_138741 [Lipomyces starkeyi NRRL Y-11557]|uniref:Uncharacterized protein n=1 Tax=Lipomyces starkeyi NRRL Y-11557 TaxID=675824 RepID=A0A1E3QG34_LIPST|nr:hypothetical protein LIPSTDRAFT_138741 [Lipomyces starkeyi NRRL Y-11557]
MWHLTQYISRRYQLFIALTVKLQFEIPQSSPTPSKCHPLQQTTRCLITYPTQRLNCHFDRDRFALARARTSFILSWRTKITHLSVTPVGPTGPTGHTNGTICGMQNIYIAGPPGLECCGSDEMTDDVVSIVVLLTECCNIINGFLTTCQLLAAC